MRSKIAAGNWKMNLSIDEGNSLIKDFLAAYPSPVEGTAVIFAPPFTHLQSAAALTTDRPDIHIAGQDIHHKESGAYTGEISGDMLISAGCSHVIIGHSERRLYFGESNELLGAKIETAIRTKLIPIYCVGETLAQREAGETAAVVTQQIEMAFQVAGEIPEIIVAYEPVWAIGTGVTASPEQAQEVHALIRSLLVKTLGPEAAESTSILYGGSVKPSNSRELFAQSDIDGGLVGGASLKADSFADIAKSF